MISELNIPDVLSLKNLQHKFLFCHLLHNRIQLMFGEEYGLKVESEADEGTKVTIHIPAIPFNSENQSKMEEKSVERKGKNEKE